MSDIATLGIKIDSRDVKAADASLDKLAVTAKKTATATDKLTNSSKKGATATGKTTSATEAATRATAKNTRAANDNTRATDKGTKSKKASATAMRVAARAAVALTAALGIRAIVQYSNSWVNVGNAIRQVTDGTKELNDVMGQVFDASKASYADLSSTASLYQKLALASGELGLSNKELIAITGTITKSFTLSGATAAESAGSIRQLGQALASGALRGDEFNSIAEQAPIIMRAIATETGLSIGALREFAATGGITAEIVVNALQNARGEIDGAFNNSVKNMAQGWTNVGSSIMRAFGLIDEAFGASGGVAGMFNDFSISIDQATDDVVEFLTEIRKIGPVSTTVAKAFVAIWKANFTLWKTLIKTPYRAMKELGLGIMGIQTEAGEGVVDLWKETWAELEGIWGDATTNLTQDIEEIPRVTKVAAKNTFQAWDDMLADLKDKFKDLGADITDSLTDAFESSIKNGDSFFKAFFGDLKNMAFSAAAQIAKSLVFQPLVNGATSFLTGGSATGSPFQTGGAGFSAGGSFDFMGMVNGVSGAFNASGAVLANGFVDGMFALGNPLSAGLENAIADGLASSPYGAIGAFGASMLGLSNSDPLINGLASTAGSIIGGAVGGPIGAAIGGFIGSAAGGLIGGDPGTNEASAAWSFDGTGSALVNRNHTNEGQEQPLVDLGNSLFGSIGEMFDRLGVDTAAAAQAAIVNTEGVTSLMFNTPDAHTKFDFDPQDAESMDRALGAVILRFLETADSIENTEVATALLNGTLGETATAINASIASIEAKAAYEEALPMMRENFNAGIARDILNIIDPTAAAINEITDQFDAMRIIAEELSLPLEEVNRLEQLRKDAILGAANDNDFVGNDLVDSAFTALRASISAEKALLRTAFDADITRIRDEGKAATTALRDQISTVNSASNSLSNLSGVLSRTLAIVTSGGVTGRLAARKAALASIQSALGSAQSGGSLAGVDLTDDLSTLSKPSQDLFETFLDYQRDFQKTNHTLIALKAEADLQLTVEEQMLETLNEQLEAQQLATETQIATAQTAYDAQIVGLDLQLDVARQQLDMLTGINTSILSLSDATASFSAAVTTTTAATAASSVSSDESFIRALYTSVSGRSSVTPEEIAFHLNDIGNFADRAAFSSNFNQAVLLPQNIATSQQIDSGFTPTAAQLAVIQSAGIPGFARGGSHRGGLRIVGEHGPELEATGPSKIMSNSDMKSAMGNGDVVRAITEMNNKIDRTLVVIARNTQQTHNVLDDWDVIGMPPERAAI